MAPFVRAFCNNLKSSLTVVSIDERLWSESTISDTFTSPIANQPQWQGQAKQLRRRHKAHYDTYTSFANDISLTIRSPTIRNDDLLRPPNAPRAAYLAVCAWIGVRHGSQRTLYLAGVAVCLQGIQQRQQQSHHSATIVNLVGAGLDRFLRCLQTI
eukprot:1809354-Pleurochrysis_carterae.AAC.4